MSIIEARLEKLGFILPSPKKPVAHYLGTKRSGDLLFVSGRVSERRGQVDADVSEEEARMAAQETMLILLSIIKDDGVNLDDIVSIEKVQGFVNSSSTFMRQPQIIDGASDLLIALYGEAGRHARTATGAAQLPFGASVQLDLIVRLRRAG